MQHAVPAGEGAMCSSSWTEQRNRGSERTDCRCVIANYNCPGQIVITGDRAVAEAAEKLKEAGAKTSDSVKCQRTVPSPLLATAGKNWERIWNMSDFMILRSRM